MQFEREKIMQNETLLHYLIAQQQFQIRQLEHTVQALKGTLSQLFAYTLQLQSIAQDRSTLKSVYAVLDHLPANCFALDSKAMIHYCNLAQAHAMHSDSCADFNNRSLVSLAAQHQWTAEGLQKILENNHHVITLKQSLTTEESMLVEGQCKCYLSYKQPFTIAGQGCIVLGVAYDISQQKLLESQLQQEQHVFHLVEQLTNQQNIDRFIQNLKQESIIVNINTKPVTLTKKQIIALIYLICYGEIKRIAAAMSISPRTAEEHLNNIREKFQCQNKSELIVFIFTHKILNQLI